MPAVALGVLTRTQLEVGVPLAYVGGTARRRASGLADVELSMLRNLTVESAIPALALVGDVPIPAGGFGPDRAYPSLKGIGTQTVAWARFHVNGQHTFGDRLSRDATDLAAADSAGVPDWCRPVTGRPRAVHSIRGQVTTLAPARRSYRNGRQASPLTAPFPSAPSS
ncbi:hypothetical protein [Roseisolibacter agri]|uniref:Uncharacterized protein n=1 Tax=Roseisolibacter agri TaxID=2014610 RepID=A0AA37QFW2_9BACT|nr:hypothetical protein [Roseisolibacter agri]GLC28146.1 hypothetical protein rosag_46590 [Roseisolibacter agri]